MCVTQTLGKSKCQKTERIWYLNVANGTTSDTTEIEKNQNQNTISDTQTGKSCATRTCHTTTASSKNLQQTKKCYVTHDDVVISSVYSPFRTHKHERVQIKRIRRSATAFRTYLCYLHKRLHFPYGVVDD